MKKYESPKVEFQYIRTSGKIANTCWGHHGSTTQLWYDNEGPGYISFQIAGGSCAFNPINVEYHKFPEGADLDKAYNDFYSKVINSGGDQGNPFKGEGTIIIPGPNPGFS